MADVTGQLTKLIEVTGLQKVLDELAHGTGLAMLMVDYLGNPVTKHSCCSAFCHEARNDPGFSGLCKKCDSRGGIEAARLHQPYIYTCHMGVTDFAIPVMLEGEYVGAILGGQVLSTNDKYEKIVSELTEIPDRINRLKSELPVYESSRIDALAQMVFFLINYIMGEGRSKLLPSDPGGAFLGDGDQKGTIAPAIRYIDAHFKESLSLAQMSMLCDLSPTYFCKQFKKLLGYNFTEYINQKRVNYAKTLLAETTRSVADIAYELGYEDSGYFIKVFKKIVGETPHNFRTNRNK